MAEMFEEVSYDILEWFPILYCQEVFSYLSRRDVTQASLVNKEWYKLTASKLKLVFKAHNERYLTDEAKGILRSSKRRYQNIEFDGVLGVHSSGHSNFLLELLEARAGSWRNVTLCSVYTDKHTLTKVIGIIEPTVERLSITKMGLLQDGMLLSEPMNVESKWTFPCLKSLDCQKSPGQYNFYPHFYDCTNLSKLSWSTFSDLPEMNLEVLPLLRNNSDLKELDIFAKDWALLEHSSEYKFKLRKFKFTCSTRSAEMAPHLYAFLESHAVTLESLETNVQLDQSLLKLILNMMPRLTSLAVTFSNVNEAISNWLQPFPVNTTIATLALKGEIKNDQLTEYQTLMRALRSLKHLKLDRTTDEQFHFLAQESPALESLEVRFFYISRLTEHEIFPNIKSLRVVTFNDDFPEPSGDYKFAALVRKEMREFFPIRYFN